MSPERREQLRAIIDTCAVMTEAEWFVVLSTVRQKRTKNWETKREQKADALAAVMDMTPEGYVREWVKRGRGGDVPLEAWEWAYQRAGLIEQAQRMGYIEIGRNVGCIVTLTEKGEALL